MAKDSYWFKHDSTAGRGTKILMIQKIYGHWGKGVYWDVIEVLREQDEYRFEKNETSLGLLADLIRADENKFNSWYLDCIKIGLLNEDETHFFSNTLIENMQEWERQKRNGSQGGRPKKTNGLNPNLKPSGYEKQKPTPKTIRGEKRIKEKSMLFRDSVFFDKSLFKEALPDWTVEQLKYYYEVVLNWSDSDGNKKVNWIATVKNFKKKDESEGKTPWIVKSQQRFPLQGTVN